MFYLVTKWDSLLYASLWEQPVCYLLTNKRTVRSSLASESTNEKKLTQELCVTMYQLEDSLLFASQWEHQWKETHARILCDHVPMIRQSAPR